jgi:serine O-acetyltransferase
MAVSVKNLMKILFLLVSSLRLLPHWIIFNVSKNTKIMKEDTKRWLVLYQLNKIGIQIGFLFLMTYYPDYRNLFYYRIGLIQYVIKFLCKPMDTLYLSTKDIGPGLVLWHGFSTIIYAKSIGKNCTIRQQITVGNLGNKDVGKSGEELPIIGDNVEIGAGAIIIGNITIGNNSIIGAGAVVTKNVPENCSVIGVPAYINRKNGIKTKEAL